MQHKITLIGAAIDACASTVGAADTPDILTQKWLPDLNIKFDSILYCNLYLASNDKNLSINSQILHMNNRLCSTSNKLL